MSKGAISFDMVADAMRTATSEGGQFFNAMQTQSETAAGQISTLKDNITAFFGELSEGASEALTEEILPKAIEMVDWLNEKLDDGSLEEWLKNGATAAATFGGALGALNIALVINDLANLKKGTEAYTAATKLGTAAQKLHNATLLQHPAAKIFVVVAALAAGVVAYAATHESASEKIANANKEVEKSIDDLDKSYKDSIKAIDDKMNAEIAEAEQVTHLKNRLYELEDSVKSGKLTDEQAAKAKDEFAGIASQLEGIIPGITSNLYDETGAINIQRTAVDELAAAYVRLMLAKAKADAYKSKVQALYEKQIDIRTEHKKATDVYLSARANVTEDQTYANNKAYLEAKDNLDTIVQSYADTNRLIKQYTEEANLAVSDLITEETQYNALAGNGGGSSGGTSYSGASSSGGSSSSGGGGRSSSSSKSASEQAIENLKHQYKMGEISHEEYLNNLEKLNNAYYAEDTAEHNKYAEEIYAERKKLADEQTKLQKEAAEEALRIQEEARDEELEILKYKLAVGELSEFEYYKHLADYRDKYFEETSEEYRQLTQEIKQWLDAQAQETIDKWQSMIDELKDKRSNLKDAFAIDKKAVGSVTFHYGDSTEKITTLVDTSYDNAQLEKYNKLLKEYKDRTGTMDKFIVGQLQGLNTSDGIAYLELLLTKSEEEFNAYMDGIKYNDKLAAENADLLMENEFADIKQMYERELGQLPDDFFSIGKESADMFGQGFLKEFEHMWKNMEQEIVCSLNSLPQMGLMSIYAREAAETGPSQQINDNRSYTYNLPSATPRQVFETEKQSQIYSWHTGITNIYNK